MKELGRNLRYWSWIIQKTVVSLTLLMIIVTYFSTISNDLSFIDMLPAQMILMAGVMCYAYTISGITVHLPQSISFGTTRKHSTIAMLIMNHLAVAEYIVVIFLVCFLLQNDQLLVVLKPFFLTFLGIFLILLGIGNCIGCIYLVYGPNKGAILYFIALMITVCFGIVFMLATSTDFLSISISGPFADFMKGPWVLFIGLLVDATTIPLLYKTIQKRDLQFA